MAEPYNKEKVAIAIRKSFASTGQSVTDETILTLVNEVENFILSDTSNRHVERIQDEVERSLMEHGFYAEAKNYILYRWQRTERRKALNHIVNETGDETITDTLKGIGQDFPRNEYSLTLLAEKFSSFYKPEMTPNERLTALIKAAVELTTQEAPDWEFIAARLLNFQLGKKLTEQAEFAGVLSFYEKLRYLTDEGLYGSYILASYSPEEIEEAAGFICPERDKLFNYSGLDLLVKRYLIRTRSHEPIESVQEMYLGIALHLAMPERHNRLQWVRKFYDLLSKLEVTMATPTLANARKPYHQLSSCFIDTVPDSLEGIYRSIDNFAMVSKFGGGMGMYFGKVRAAGGNIRGFKGVAGGVIRWMKLVNDTAVAVDQLGMRQGAVAVYLDVWHKDLPEFLQLRTNNGDDRIIVRDGKALEKAGLFLRDAKHAAVEHDAHAVRRFRAARGDRDGLVRRGIDVHLKLAELHAHKAALAGLRVGGGELDFVVGIVVGRIVPAERHADEHARRNEQRAEDKKHLFAFFHHDFSFIIRDRF